MCPRSHKECKTGIWGRFGWSPCPTGAQKHLLSTSLSASWSSRSSPWSLWTLLPKSAAGWGSSCFSPSWGRCLCDLVSVSHHFFQIPLEENQAPFSSRQKKKKCLLKIQKVQKSTHWKVSFSPTHRLCWLISQVSFQANTRNICVYICVSFFSFPLHKWYLVWWGDSHYRLWRQSLWI